MAKREKQAEAIAAMIATDIQRAAARLQPGDTLQLQITYNLFMRIRFRTNAITGEQGATMYFGDAQVLINESLCSGNVAYAVSIVTKTRIFGGEIL